VGPAALGDFAWLFPSITGHPPLPIRIVDPSSLVRWRKRLGASGMDKIMQSSILGQHLNLDPAQRYRFKCVKTIYRSV